MATSCGYEFQVKHFRFEDCDESQFYEFQWTKKKLFFVLYRAFTFLYHWGWLIASWVLAEDDITYTISNWSFFFTGIYFMTAFFTALYGIVANKDADVATTEQRNGANGSAERGDIQPSREIIGGSVRWFHKIVWFFHVQAMAFVIYVTVLYWAVLAPGVPLEKLRLPLGQHKHSVQAFLLLLDMFLIAFPTRWLHVFYNMLFAFFYSVFVVIMHFAGVDSAAYGFLDFVKNPGLAAGVLVAATLVAPFILHTITFALYHLRALIYRNTVGKQKTDGKAKFETGHDNVAFSE